MIFRYSHVNSLQETPKVGTKQCVALLQHYIAGIGPTSTWKEGEPVLGNQRITPGTAIATFVNGRYPNVPHGNHAAMFLCHAPNGFYVMDQWSDDVQKRHVSSRLIRTRSKTKLTNGWWPGGGDNAYAYSIIER